MNSQFRGFAGTEVYTLIVGREEKHLSVPHDILTLVPFFATALSSGAFEESRNKVFRLPEDDPQAMADLLSFSYTNEVKEIDSLFADDAAEMAISYIRAYIVADEFKAEVIANRLVDRIIRVYASFFPTSSQITLLSQANLENKLLYQLLVDTTAYGIVGNFYDGSVYEDVSELCENLSKADLSNIMKAIPRLKISDKDPAKEVWANRCNYHNHELTEPCHIFEPTDLTRGLPSAKYS